MNLFDKILLLISMAVIYTFEIILLISIVSVSNISDLRNCLFVFALLLPNLIYLTKNAINKEE